MTAIFTDDSSEKKAYSLGALDYLTKPFDDEVLRAKVAALTSRDRHADLVEHQAGALRHKDEETRREHQARQVAEASNRAKDEFLSVVSHELRGPLNATMGAASLLRDEVNLSERGAKAVETILRNVRAQSKRVDDLIDLSQLAMGTLKIERVPVDVSEILVAAIATMSPAALDRGVRIELAVAPGRYGTVGDPLRLEQLFGHLLSNAIKFSPPNSVVHVELSGGSTTIQVRVRDYGVGIAPELLPHIFDPFRQSDRSWARHHGGLGIGLTMARSFGELHGGTLEASSGGQGQGAELLLTLPIAEGHHSDAPAATATVRTVRETPAANETGARPLRNLRILVVDDDRDFRELLPVILSDAGASVGVAASAKEAVALFERATFDVLLSDLGMPGEDGLWLVRQIRRLDAARGGTLKAVAISGYGSTDDRRRSAEAGFDDHWTKPYEVERLIDSLVRLTSRRRS